jgi:hypothetical protein
MGPPCTLIVMCSLCCVIYLFDGWYLNTFSADDLQMHTPICYSMKGENVGIYPQECCGYMCCSSAVVGRCVMSKYLWIGASLTPIGKHHHLQLHLISNDGKIIRRCTPSYGDGRCKCNCCYVVGTGQWCTHIEWLMGLAAGDICTLYEVQLLLNPLSFECVEVQPAPAKWAGW